MKQVWPCCFFKATMLIFIKELVRVNGISPRPNEEARNTVPVLLFLLSLALLINDDFIIWKGYLISLHPISGHVNRKKWHCLY